MIPANQRLAKIQLAATADGQDVRMQFQKDIITQPEGTLRWTLPLWRPASWRQTKACEVVVVVVPDGPDARQSLRGLAASTIAQERKWENLVWWVVALVPQAHFGLVFGGDRVPTSAVAGTRWLAHRAAAAWLPAILNALV